MFSVNEDPVSIENEILKLQMPGMSNFKEVKDALQEAIPQLEATFESLPSPAKEVAQSLYLQKIRSVSFGFHLAILKLKAKAEFRGNPNRDAMQTFLTRFDEDSEKLARLYKLL